MSLIVKNKLKTINKLMLRINIILFIVLIFSVIRVNRLLIQKVEDPEPEILSYEWDVLHIEYDGLSRDSVINKLGLPDRVNQILIYERILGIRGPLISFKKHPDDTVSFEQLYYRQGEFDFYLWLLPDKDSVWRVVDAIKYNPEKVQF